MTYDGDDMVCPACGHRILSVVDDRLDQMVQQASIPNLATLFKRAKDAGIIAPGKEYGGP
jgi:hypothetical protein